MPPTNSPTDTRSQVRPKPNRGPSTWWPRSNSARYSTNDPSTHPPQQVPSRSGTPFASAIRELATPVPDLASTLGVAEDEIIDSNISFLRAHHDISDAVLTMDRLERELRERTQRRLEDGRQEQQEQQQQPALQARDASSHLRDTALDERERQYQAHRAQLIQQRHESQEAWADRMGSRVGVAAYGDRIPDQQSLYDWAPSRNDGDADASSPTNANEIEVQRLMTIIREQQPNTHPEIVRALARMEFDTQRAQSSHSNPSRSQPGQQEPSLRSAAILQSASRNWRFANRSRDIMARYNHERDRDRLLSNNAPEINARPAPPQLIPVSPDSAAAALQQQLQSSAARVRHAQILQELHAADDALPNLRRTQNRSPWPQVNPTNGSTVPERDPATLEVLRRRYMDGHAAKVSEFERIIKYLHRVRLEDAIAGLNKRDMDALASEDSMRGPKMHQDVVRDMKHVRPHRSSWLTPGMTFIGQQQATPLGAGGSSSTTLHRLAGGNGASGPGPRVSLGPSSTSGRTVNAIPYNASSVPAAAGISNGGPSTSSSCITPPETWTVKVALHAVDYEHMTLQGTMEAFGVPSFSPPSMSMPSTRTRANQTADPAQPGGTGDAASFNQAAAVEMDTDTTTADDNKTTFSTYLEGEIIDFATHSLLTESDRQFAQKTTPDIDAAYWRKLEPFAQLTDEQIARALLDRQWIEEQLMGKYILMRWKERCFVRPTFTSFSNRSVSPPWESSGAQGGMTSSTGQHSPTATRTTPLSASTLHGRGGGAAAAPAVAALPGGSPAPHTSPNSTTSFLAGADGAGYGLSISGFYYVSMRRSDGRCEGLYFDPQSSPYQRLELAPTSRGLWAAGAWEVR